MIIRTEAVPLRNINYGDTSQIVTLYTRSSGKIAVIAKGARSSKSKFGSSLQPMSYSQVVFYYKPTRRVQTLKETSHVESLHGISSDLNKIEVGFRIVELTNRLMQEEEQNEPAFELLRHVLVRLNKASQRIENLWPFFQLRLATLLGFAPRIDKQQVRDIDDDGGWLTLDNGTVSQHRPSSTQTRQASRTALRAFAIFARAGLDTIMRMNLETSTRREVRDLITSYLQYHFDELALGQSGKVFDQMIDIRNTLPGPD